MGKRVPKEVAAQTTGIAVVPCIAADTCIAAVTQVVAQIRSLV